MLGKRFRKLKITLLVLIVIIFGFLGIVAIKPADYRITRSTTIKAAPDAIFTKVNDLNEWKSWSPWEKLDPNMKRTIEGAPAGQGATYKWEGNKDVGKGQMTITQSKPAELVQLKLEFLEPFQNTCMTDFNFKPQGSETSVTWEMYGKRSFMEKAICLFMDMDKMVGGDFEKGLAQLKAVCEPATAK